ncbi:chromosomal replication initiator protein DnaA [Fundidesulfovibrio butyratiphilus]
MNALWTQTQHILERSLNPGIFQVWIKPLQAAVDGRNLTLTAPNEFVASWVRERLASQVVEAAAQVMGESPSLRVVVASSSGAVCAAGEILSVPAPATAPARMIRPRPAETEARAAEQVFRFSFDQFVVGPSNALAYEASLGLCRESLQGDQLFISAGPGLGKTHLTQAMGQKLSAPEKGKRSRVVYVTAEEFSSRLILALKMREMERFKTRFRDNVDILILEDVHFFQGKPKLQDELLNTISALQTRGCRVVMTSSFLPKELSGVDNQLVSRLCAGFLATIEAPDLQTRRNILESKARVHQVMLPGEVAELLAGRIRTDIRQLESCLNNLVLKARILGRGISLDMAWDVLKNYNLDSPGICLDQIVEYVCSTYDLNNEQLVSKSRKRQLVLARNTAFFLARKHTELSLQAIGERFNRRHSTVVKGITTVERHLSLQTPIGRQLEQTIDRLSQ